MGYFRIQGENRLMDIPPEKQDIRCADDTVLGKIVDTGNSLEKHFGCPQDVEWAMEKGEIYILQSRAITTLAPSEERDGKLWTRAYGDEYWADATTPLFFTTMGKMLVEYVNHEGARKMGYKDLYDAPLIKLHKTRVYFYVVTLEAVFAHYPKFIRSKEILNYFPKDMQEGILDKPNDMWGMIRSQLKPAFLDRDGLMGRTDKAYKRWASGFIEFCRDRIDSIDLQSLSDADLEQLYWDLEEASKKHYRLIRYGMVSHSIVTNLLIKNWLKKWLDDDGTMYSQLVSGLPGNKTVETNAALSDLAQCIRDNPDIGERIDSMGPGEFLGWMDSNENPLSAEMERFLETYGHRANTREIMAPRWREDRQYVVNVARQISLGDTDMRSIEQ